MYNGGFVYMEKFKAYAFRFYIDDGKYMLEGTIGDPTSDQLVVNNTTNSNLELEADWTTMVKSMMHNLKRQVLGNSNDPSAFWKSVPEMGQMVECPVCTERRNILGTNNMPFGYCSPKQRLMTTIIQLNDYHRWSREKIADWIDTLETQPVFYPRMDIGDGQEKRLGNVANVVEIQSANQKEDQGGG